MDKLDTCAHNCGMGNYEASYEATRKYKADWQRLKKYGMPLGTFDSMAEQQGHACAICREVTTLFVDHDHATGLVRDLLCGGCNKGLGMFGENLDRLTAAMVYLVRHQPEG